MSHLIISSTNHSPGCRVARPDILPIVFWNLEQFFQPWKIVRTFLDPPAKTGSSNIKLLIMACLEYPIKSDERGPL